MVVMPLCCESVRSRIIKGVSVGVESVKLLEDLMSVACASNGECVDVEFRFGGGHNNCASH
jgi:hypothetical protein